MESCKVTTAQNKKVVLVIIDDLSNDLKELIRGQLSTVCHGPSKAGGTKRIYSYKKTLKEFFARYEDKEEATKKGFIGELLAHLFLNAHLPFDQASPYFNTEERQIKKGFDVVFYETENKKIWFTEVKSGAVAKKEANEGSRGLLHTAKRDLKDKFESGRVSLWLNAVSGVRNAINDGKIKEEILSILEDLGDDADENLLDSSEQNAILTSVVYSDTGYPVAIKELKALKKSIEEENIFDGLLLVAIQKKTFERVEEFLRSEMDRG